MLTHTLTVLLSFVVLSTALNEPQLCSKFDYDIKTLEKMLKVEFAVAQFEDKLRQWESSIEASINRFNEMDAERIENLSRLQKDIENRTDTMETKLEETEKGLDNKVNTIESKLEETEKGLDNKVNKIESKLEETQNTFAGKLSRDVTDMMAEINATVVQAAELSKNNSQQVAFSAHGATGKMVNGVLTFKNVYLNLGDGYDKMTGVFRCPVAGTYLFSATLVSVRSRSSNMFCNIRKNTSNVVIVYSHEGLYDSASVSALLHLSVGDLVDLGNCVRVNYIFTASMYTSFIGSLIQAD